jgi:hypothetical protein
MPNTDVTTAVQDTPQRSEEELAEDLHGAVQTIPEDDEDEGGKQEVDDVEQRVEGDEDVANNDDAPNLGDGTPHVRMHVASR